MQRRGESPAGGGSWNIDLGSFHWAMPPPTYGSWGAVAGRPGEAANPGNAPCIGAGLMNKLAKRLVVALTPGTPHVQDVLQVPPPMRPVGGAGGQDGPQDSGGARLRQGRSARTQTATTELERLASRSRALRRRSEYQSQRVQAPKLRICRRQSQGRSGV